MKAYSVIAAIVVMTSSVQAASCNLKDSDQDLLDGLAAAHAAAEAAAPVPAEGEAVVPLYADEQAYCDARLNDVLKSYADQYVEVPVVVLNYIKQNPDKVLRAIQSAKDAGVVAVPK